MITIRAIVVGKDAQHALSLAAKIKSGSDGCLTTLVDKNRIYCSLQCSLPIREFDEPGEYI